ncbi:hypothetical protein [Psychroserpens sp.]|uniref:hypothetical protein n=1 Tax=Psychroserpens sp. TaxID=2020870 RepID=UPI002B2737FA|nr:hypothetical protein [Psychroserpens sp.]
MKTKTFFSNPLTYIMLAIIATSFSCAPIHRSNLTVTPSSIDSVEDEWEQFYAGGSAGYGSNTSEDFTTSSFCFGAELMYNFFGDDNGALYGGIFGNYNSSSSDNVDESLIRGGLRGRYFDHVIPSKRLQAVYGIDLYAGSGQREFSMAKDDVTVTGGSAVVGLNLNFENNLSLGLEAPVFNLWNETYKYDGGEIDVSNTSFGLNKNNIIMAYLRFGF